MGNNGSIVPFFSTDENGNFQFLFDGSPVTAGLTPDGEPYFIANDLCEPLGIKSAKDAVARLDDDEKGAVLSRTSGGVQQVLVVNESGLYSLVLSSRKPKAKQFKRWITHELLPQLRKQGFFIVHGITPEQTDILRETLADRDAENTDLKREVKALRRMRDEDTSDEYDYSEL